MSQYNGYNSCLPVVCGLNLDW